MVKQSTIDKLAMGLRKKYFAKSDYMIVAHMIADDINNLKKFEILNSFEMAEVFRQAVCMTDGEDVFHFFEAEHGGNVVDVFCTSFP